MKTAATLKRITPSLVRTAVLMAAAALVAGPTTASAANTAPDALTAEVQPLLDMDDTPFLAQAVAPDGIPTSYGSEGTGNPRTDDCTVTVRAGSDPQAPLDAAPAGAVICYAAADYSTRSLLIDNPVTVRANGVVKIKSVIMTGRDVTFDGFTVVGGVLDAPRTAVYFSGTGHQIINNLITGRGIHYAISCKGDTCGSDIRIARNTITKTHNIGIYLFAGDSIVIEENNIYDLYTSVANDDVDAMRVWGTNHIIRNNYIHDLNAEKSVGDQHVDCFQNYQGSGRITRNMLIENNYCVRVSGQCLILQNSSTTNYDLSGYIYRGNVCESYGFQNLELAGVKDVAIENNLFNGGVTGNVLSFKTSKSGLRTSNVALRNNIILKARDAARYVAGTEALADATQNVLLVNKDIYTTWLSFVSRPSAPPARVAGDFMLYRQRAQAGGSIVNVGARAITPGQMTDVDGGPRVLGGVIDIGPYEIR
jgi:hypothetical protein